MRSFIFEHVLVFYIELRYPTIIKSLKMSLVFRLNNLEITTNLRGRRGRDRMVVGFITTYTINAYHY